jgi:hypothetical protein
MESITLLLAFLFLRWDRVPNANFVSAVYTIVTALLIASIFRWKIFPVCFVDSSGLTPFKIYSEYLICAILIVAIFLLQRNKEKFEEKIFRTLLLSMMCTVISELAFTLYISNYGFSNLVGHYFKIFSFCLVYEAIIKTGIERPFEVIFLDLDRANNGLKKEIEVGIKTQQEKEKLIDSLKKAADEIKILQGMLPICSVCKNIRDDKGYWNCIESYLSEHSELVFSHGICPECAIKHYGDFYKPQD